MKKATFKPTDAQRAALVAVEALAQTWANINDYDTTADFEIYGNYYDPLLGRHYPRVTFKPQGEYYGAVGIHADGSTFDMRDYKDIPLENFIANYLTP